MAALSDAELAERIRTDRIDILFDLAGHTAGGRLLVFARRPAPVQIEWLSYLGTTGLTAIDYILMDHYLAPPGVEAYYREKVLRLPDVYVCFSPPDDAPAGGTAAGDGGGTRHAGQLQQSGQVVARRAGAVGGDHAAGARLAAGTEAQGGVPRCGRPPLPGSAGRTGHPRDRVELPGWSPDDSLLELYNRIDLALDPFPYNGAMTTCEALWMGVPVIICAGRDVCRPARLDPLDRRRLRRVGGGGSVGLRAAGGGVGPRPAAAGGVACRSAAADGRRAFVRRSAVCREFADGLTRRVAVKYPEMSPHWLAAKPLIQNELCSHG